MEDVDESAHRAVMQANGTDKRGQGGAKATIISVVTEHEGGARVSVDTDYAITGRLARFGRGGMIEDVSKRLLRDFATCLQNTLGADQGAATVTADADAGGESETPAVGPHAREVAATAPQAGSAQATGAEVGGGAQAVGAQASGPPAAARQSNAPKPAPRPPAQAKPLNALSLLFSVLRDRVRSLIAQVRSRRRR
jgi:flagellar biosynthesis/type III secretory pathway M-ring protein FliF/YscJ